MENNIRLTKPLLWLMTIGAGLVVANNYYNQPLLGKIATDFKIAEAMVAKVAMLTQVGYAAGLLLIIPLGDMLSRKKLILIDFIFIIIALLAAGFSTNIYQLMVASFFIGLTSVVPQLFVPLAAQLAEPGEKGKAIGQVMSGLLIGILFSRTISGMTGEYWGWKAIFFIAAGAMLLMAAFIQLLLPNVAASYKGSYSSLMKSLVHYTKELPALRIAALRGMLGFASFSAFWTTLVFYLEGPPFYKGSDIIGAFGIIGAAGALAASLSGKWSEKINKFKLITAMILLMLMAWGIMGAFSQSITGLIIGVILLDWGLQSMHIVNQTIIFSIYPEARNRLNTVYMVAYFVGGSLGTLGAVYAWQQHEWRGVVLWGILLVALTLLLHLRSGLKKKVKP